MKGIDPQTICRFFNDCWNNDIALGICQVPNGINLGEIVSGETAACKGEAFFDESIRRKMLRPYLSFLAVTL